MTACGISPNCLWICGVRRPLLLSSQLPQQFYFYPDLATSTFSARGTCDSSRETLHLVRSRFPVGGIRVSKSLMFGESRIGRSVNVPLRNWIFFSMQTLTDIFEVRGTARERRGRRIGRTDHGNSRHSGLRRIGPYLCARLVSEVTSCFEGFTDSDGISNSKARPRKKVTLQT